MDKKSILNLRKKENKNEIEEELLKYCRFKAFVSEVLVSDSKYEISSKEAIEEIRAYIRNNF